MSFRDLLKISLGSLSRRRLRTFLTVLGVFIGVTSIVVMLSLGIGLKQFFMSTVEQLGSLTQVTVYNYGDTAQDKNAETKFLTDEKVDSFRSIPHVQDAYPVLETSVLMKQGPYEANITLTGIPIRAMRSINLQEGTYPKESDNGLKLLVGNMVGTNFYDPKASNQFDYGMDGLEQKVDFRQPMFTIFDTAAYYAAKNPASGDDGTKPTAPKKYILDTVGYIEGKPGSWNRYSYSVIADLDQLKAQLRKIYGKRAIPDQPTNKKGKPYRYFVYNEARVDVDDMEEVETVQKTLQDMGYQATSQMEYLKQTQQTSNMIQAVLGGIGAVSLLVAAIGIANTMMMSIYERTKEIGIMKVLGCDMRDIRSMFLIEAGLIGLMGGVFGLVFSYGISVIINRLLGGAIAGSEMGGDVASVSISVIPIWLAAAALVFAVLVGMAAGFFPAQRAMKLSPLSAIRNE
ncbi:ABC transporter permease [[Clostridium] aminophilum]|uniref:ABC transporter permease n=1 Tax=[Clostridium] aminophilum TaxID=1526 RepID=UPI003323ECCE